jgi:hypothetical protein
MYQNPASYISTVRIVCPSYRSSVHLATWMGSPKSPFDETAIRSFKKLKKSGSTWTSDQSPMFKSRLLNSKFRSGPKANCPMELRLSLEIDTRVEIIAGNEPDTCRCHQWKCWCLRASASLTSQRDFQPSCPSCYLLHLFSSSCSSSSFSEKRGD